MNNDDLRDFRDLLYVVRAIRRTYEHSYGSFRHSAEIDNASQVFDRLFRRYFDGMPPTGYPNYEPRIGEQTVVDVIREQAKGEADEHAKSEALLASLKAQHG